jgi:hypothetical protein
MNLLPNFPPRVKKLFGRQLSTCPVCYHSVEDHKYEVAKADIGPPCRWLHGCYCLLTWNTETRLFLPVSAGKWAATPNKIRKKWALSLLRLQEQEEKRLEKASVKFLNLLQARKGQLSEP